MTGVIEEIRGYRNEYRLEIIIAKSDVKIDWTKLVGKAIKIEVLD